VQKSRKPVSSRKVRAGEEGDQQGGDTMATKRIILALAAACVLGCVSTTGATESASPIQKVRAAVKTIVGPKLEQPRQAVVLAVRG